MERFDAYTGIKQVIRRSDFLGIKCFFLIIPIHTTDYAHKLLLIYQYRQINVIIHNKGIIVKKDRVNIYKILNISKKA